MRGRAISIPAVALVLVASCGGGRDRPPETTPPGAGAYEVTRSSGLFSIPAEAVSIDWAVINDSERTQRFRVTVYEVPAGEPKRVASPGPIADEIEPGRAFHNANSVRAEGPFRRGFYYEIVVETDSPAVLPSVMAWSDRGNTLVPGTFISPGDFVTIP